MSFKCLKEGCLVSGKHTHPESTLSGLGKGTVSIRTEDVAHSALLPVAPIATVHDYAFEMKPYHEMSFPHIETLLKLQDTTRELVNFENRLTLLLQGICDMVQLYYSTYQTAAHAGIISARFGSSFVALGFQYHSVLRYLDDIGELHQFITRKGLRFLILARVWNRLNINQREDMRNQSQTEYNLQHAKAGKPVGYRRSRMPIEYIPPNQLKPSQYEPGQPRKHSAFLQKLLKDVEEGKE